MKLGAVDATVETVLASRYQVRMAATCIPGTCSSLYCVSWSVYLSHWYIKLLYLSRADPGLSDDQILCSWQEELGQCPAL